MYRKSNITERATDNLAFYADAIRDYLTPLGKTFGGETFYPANVFDEASPDREWTGAPTVETTERDRRRKFYLDGRFRDVVSISILIRAQSRAAALAAARAILRDVVVPATDERVASGELDDWVPDDDGVFPDVVGLSIGETHVGHIDFTMITKTEFFYEKRV